MANYYTRFSCLLPLGSAEHVRIAYERFHAFEQTLRNEGEDPHFEITNDTGNDRHELMITSGAGSGDPDHVASYVIELAQVCGLTGSWGFVWAETCDRDRIDGFGGGAMAIDLEDGTVNWLDCAAWLRSEIGPAVERSPSSPVIDLPAQA